MLSNSYLPAALLRAVLGVVLLCGSGMGPALGDAGQSPQANRAGGADRLLSGDQPHRPGGEPSGRAYARYGLRPTMLPEVSRRAPSPSIDAMIGQMLVVGFHGDTARSSHVRTMTTLLREGRIGGVILMGRNVRSRRHLTALTSVLRNSGARHRVLIGVDQEGGAVQRLSRRHGFTRVPSALLTARRHSPAGAYKIYARMARQLASAGINLNFGPVVDLNRNRRNPIIARQRRSYGTASWRVEAYARSFIDAHRDAGILTVAKHFPGHGSSRGDTHHRMIDLTRTWAAVELAPYRTLTREGRLDMVMTGHLSHRDYGEGKQLPASLAPKAINELLRGKIGFSGVVITDDLDMGAVKRRFALADRVVRAVKAGNDILLTSSGGLDGRDGVARIHAAIKRAVERGEITRARLEASWRRIMALKARLRSRGSARRQTPPAGDEHG